METTPQLRRNDFAPALALPVADRNAYLEQACGGDATLRRAVEQLLQAHEGDAGFMAEAAVAKLPGIRTLLSRSRPTEEGPGQMLGRYKLLQKIGEGGWRSRRSPSAGASR